MRQITNFLCDYGESLAVLAGPGSFDCGIQSQQIGLEGDFINNFDDLGNIVGRLVDIPHRLDHLRHLTIAFFGIVTGQHRQLIGLGGIFRILVGLRTHLLHRGRDFFHRAGGFSGALRQRLAGSGNLARTGRDLFNSHAHLSQDVVHRIDGPVQCIFDDCVVTLVIAFDFHVQVTIGHFLQAIRGFFDRFENGVQRVIDALDDFPVAAFELVSLTAGLQPTFNCRSGQRDTLGDQTIDGFDTTVQVVLDRVEIAIIGVGDLRRDIATGNLVDIVGSHIQRIDD